VALQSTAVEGPPTPIDAIDGGPPSEARKIVLHTTSPSPAAEITAVTSELVKEDIGTFGIL
jgi:hypothetical protein